MRNYEALLILKPGLGKEELVSVFAKIKEVVSKHNGEVQDIVEQGKKTLAFPISKHKEGIYCILKIKIEPSYIKALESDLKIEEPILRSMFTQG